MYEVWKTSLSREVVHGVITEYRLISLTFCLKERAGLPMCQDAWWAKSGDALRERKKNYLEDWPLGKHNPNLAEM